jgi:hypothetical protein
MHSKFWSENLKGRDLGDDLSLDGRIILENLKGRDCVDDLSLDGRIILEWILGK